MQFSGRAKVVVGVDGSEANRPALRWAVKEARARGSQLVAVHAWHVPAMAYSVPGYVPISRDWTLQQAASLLETAIRECAGEDPVEVDGRLLEGSAYDTLAQVANEPDVELVVVGTRGHGALASLVLGSVSHSLSHHCPKPLVLVPPGSGLGDRSAIRHIVVGIDGSEGAERALRWAVTEAKVHGARLELVTAWSWTTFPDGTPATDTWRDPPTVAGEVLSGAASLLGADGGDLTLTKTEGVASDVLVEAAGSADLLVVGTRGLGRPREILLGSTSHYCTHHSPVPVAVVPSAGGAT